MFTIKKGRHRAKGLHLGLYCRHFFQWEVLFDDSARYNIGSDHQADINKLCGVRFFFGDNSARIGWRYNLETGLVDIMAYVHDRGNVTKSEKEVFIRAIEIGKAYRLSLTIAKDHYFFYVGNYYRKVPRSHNQVLSYRQGLFFGGVKTAPHDIVVRIKRLVNL